MFINLQRIKYPFKTIFDEGINPFFVYEALQKRKKGFIKRCKFINLNFFQCMIASLIFSLYGDVQQATKLSDFDLKFCLKVRLVMYGITWKFQLEQTLLCRVIKLSYKAVCSDKYVENEQFFKVPFPHNEASIRAQIFRLFQTLLALSLGTFEIKIT